MDLLSEKKLALPYRDSHSPPHLRYLRHNALLANISREHSGAVRASWATLHQRLEDAKDERGNVLPARVIDENRRHAASSEKANQAAKARLDKEREPPIKEINDDLAADQRRVPRGFRLLKRPPAFHLFPQCRQIEKHCKRPYGRDIAPLSTRWNSLRRTISWRLRWTPRIARSMFARSMPGHLRALTSDSSPCSTTK